MRYDAKGPEKSQISSKLTRVFVSVSQDRRRMRKMEFRR